jgi:hypothetical protein
MKSLPTSFIVLVALLFNACKPASLGIKEYMAYIDDPSNGLLKTEEIGDFKISVQYRPVEYISVIEVRDADDDLSPAEFSKAMKENENMQFFLLRIAGTLKKEDALLSGLSREEEYYERLSHLIGGIEKNVLLVDGVDTLPCMMHHYERNYKLSDFHNITLIFEKKKDKQAHDKTLIYDDVMLGIGKIKINITRESINSIPELNTNL